MLIEISNKFKSTLTIWIMSLGSGCIFVLFAILLNYLLRGKTSFQMLEIDYSIHNFWSGHFTGIKDMDSLVVLGSSNIYWCIGYILYMKFHPQLKTNDTIRNHISHIIQFTASGFLISYFLMIFCCWSLAIYEGYTPRVSDSLFLSHGPWHFISHLKLLILMSLIPLLISSVLSVFSFIIQINKYSLGLFFLNIIVLIVYFYSHVWLID